MFNINVSEIKKSQPMIMQLESMCQDSLSRFRYAIRIPRLVAVHSIPAANL